MSNGLSSLKEYSRSRQCRHDMPAPLIPSRGGAGSAQRAADELGDRDLLKLRLSCDGVVQLGFRP